MKRNFGITLKIVGSLLAASVLYILLWALLTPPEPLNKKLSKAVEVVNINKLHKISNFIRFDSATLAGNKAVQFKFTIIKWVKGADTLKLHNFLWKDVITKVKIDKNLQEFKDSNVVFLFTYYDSTNDYAYKFNVAPANYK